MRRLPRQIVKGVKLRLAVTATGPGLSSALDSRFGRARYLVIVDLPERSVYTVENSAGMDAAQGAGVQAAQVVIDSGATGLLTGHCGPKAYRALQAAGIDVLLTDEKTVAEALDQYEAGGLMPTASADVQGHW